MSKYRKQMLQLMVIKKAADAEPVLKAHQSHSVETESDWQNLWNERIDGESSSGGWLKIQEKQNQLEFENKELQELFSTSSESLQLRKEHSVDTASEAIK